jgi:hypothetical protein
MWMLCRGKAELLFGKSRGVRDQKAGFADLLEAFILTFSRLFGGSRLAPTSRFLKHSLLLPGFSQKFELAVVLRFFFVFKNATVCRSRSTRRPLAPACAGGRRRLDHEGRALPCETAARPLADQRRQCPSEVLLLCLQSGACSSLDCAIPTSPGRSDGSSTSSL